MHLTVWALFVKARLEWPAGHDKRKYKKYFFRYQWPEQTHRLFSIRDPFILQPCNEPLHQGDAVEGGHQVKTVCIGRCSLRGLHRDFQPQLFALRTVQPGKTLDDLSVHMDAVDLVLHKDGVALAHHRQDAGQDLCLRAKGFLTMSEEAQYYYGGKKIIRQVMGFMMFVIEIIWLGNHLNGGAKYLAYVTQLPDVTCKIITVLGFGIYVFIGGYMAVVTTDAVQFIAILIGFLTIAFRAIPLVGGYQDVVDTFTAAGKPGAMTFYGLGSYGVMAAIALVLSTAMGVIGTPTHRTRIYTSKDEKTARKAFLGQGILLFGWSFVTAIIGMSCFTIATMNGDTLASGDYAFAYMATNALPPIIGMMFMICGLSATMSSGDSDAISGVTILLTDVYPSVTGKTIKEEDYAKYSRIALICTLGAAFFITLFVNDVIGYISTIVGAFLPGVAVAMLLGRFWKRVNWQGGLACIGSGTLLGVLILVLPSFKNWINATMGGPAVPATIISLVFGIVVSLMFPADTTPDDVRLKHVMDDRRGTVVEKVAAAEAAAEEEEDL